MEEEWCEEFRQEIAGIYAFFGQAFANGFEVSPSYTAEDIEKFLGYDVSYTLDHLADEGVIEVEEDERVEDKIYKMADEDAKAKAFETWKVVRDEFDKSFEEMAFNFDEAEEVLDEKDLKYA